MIRGILILIPLNLIGCHQNVSPVVVSTPPPGMVELIPAQADGMPHYRVPTSFLCENDPRYPRRTHTETRHVIDILLPATEQPLEVHVFGDRDPDEVPLLASGYVSASSLSKHCQLSFTDAEMRLHGVPAVISVRQLYGWIQQRHTPVDPYPDFSLDTLPLHQPIVVRYDNVRIPAENRCRNYGRTCLYFLPNALVPRAFSIRPLATAQP